MLPSCRSCSVPESACGTICGAWRPTTRSRRKRQGAAPSTLPSNVSWPMTSGDHGLLHMVHDGFPVSVLGQCPLFWFQNQNQTVRSHPIAVQIGTASCRERVCQYVSISVVAVSLKRKINTHTTTKTQTN